MHLRRVTLVLALSLAGTGLGAMPAEAACAGAPPRISLTAFRFVEGPSRFYLGEEGQNATATIALSGGCGANMTVDWATGPGTAVPVEDFQQVSGTAQAVVPGDMTVLRPAEVPILSPGGAPDAMVESATFSLSNPTASGAGTPTLLTSTAAILIVDADAPSRVGFEGLPYSQSETFAAARIPVFRAGPISSPTTVNYEIAPDPAAPATPGQDYNAPAAGTLTFSDIDRVASIDLEIINDSLGEGPESVIITLSDPSTGTSIENAQTTFTILDNEENVFPKSRFHHPRHKWKYKKSDYRIREFHIFATDEGGSGVVGSELALRRNLKSGKCAWLTKSGWQKKDCQNRQWLPTKYDDAGQLFYYRMKQLKSSVGTKIKNYTAFSRAIDGAGNVEKEFVKKRNDNTFEIKRKSRR